MHQSTAVKRTPLLIALGIFASIAIIIFIYDFRLENKHSPWDFIGDKTVLVYQPPSSSHDLIEQTFDTAIADFTSLQDKGAKDIWSQWLAGGDVVVALSTIARDNFDFTFYIPLSAKRKKQLSDFRQLITSKKAGLRQRTFEGVVIEEIISPSKKIFSFTVIQDILIVSTTPFLVEDAVRTSVSENPHTFKKDNFQLFQLSTLDKDDGDLLINVPEFFRWMKSFSNDEIFEQNLPFGKSLVTDIKLDDENAIFNGFATDSIESGKSFLSLFNRQSPVEFEMKTVVPTNTAAVLHYGISNFEAWQQDREAFFKIKKNAIQDSLKSFTGYQFNPTEFYKTLDNELGLCLVTYRSSVSSIFTAELKDIAAGKSMLDKLADKVSATKKDSSYAESYSGYTIRKIDLLNFSHTLFWPMASKSAETYFAVAGKYVLFSESDDVLKEFIDNLSEDNVWSKSVRWNTFLQTTLQGSNIDLIFDTDLLASYLTQRLTPTWKSYFESNRFLHVERGAVQFSRLEKDFYFAGNFPLKNSGVSAAPSKKIFNEVKFSNALVTRPFLVKNYESGNTELMVQDTTSALYLVGLNGKTSWKLPVGDKIEDDIAQIDFYKNGKLQYLFITPDKIHIVDRLGRYVAGYPKSLDSRTLEFATVVDYDKSRNYRFLLSDRDRKIFILDKEGSVLAGWDPKLLQRKLFSAAHHYRILGKDYFVSIQDDGLVHIMNRRGEPITNFPLMLNARPSGDYFFEAGKNFATSTFTLVSQSGMRIQFNLSGKIITQESLPKTSVNARFYLVASDNGKFGACIRIDNGKIAAFDQQGKLLFEKENPGGEILIPYLFDVDAGKRIFSFTDAGQNLSYLWDERGNSILTSPIEAKHTPAIQYNPRKGELMIIWTNQESMIQTSLRWPE